MRKGAVGVATLAQIRRAVELRGEGKTLQSIAADIGCSREWSRELMGLAKRHFVDLYLDAMEGYGRLATAKARAAQGRGKAKA